MLSAPFGTGQEIPDKRFAPSLELFGKTGLFQILFYFVFSLIRYLSSDAVKLVVLLQTVRVIELDRKMKENIVFAYFFFTPLRPGTDKDQLEEIAEPIDEVSPEGELFSYVLHGVPKDALLNANPRLFYDQGHEAPKNLLVQLGQNHYAVLCHVLPSEKFCLSAWRVHEEGPLPRMRGGGGEAHGD